MSSDGPLATRPGAVTMAGWQRAFKLGALRAYYWAQRQRLPLPRAIRRCGRNLLRRQVDQLIAPSADPWPQPFTAAFQGVAIGGPPSGTKPLDPAGDGALHPALRCVVATGTMGLGGQERVALFLANRLPAHGFDVVLADASPGDAVSDALDLGGAPLVKLGPHTVERWLATHRPDVINAHGTPDWLIKAAAAYGIPVVETLHGVDYLHQRNPSHSERVRSRDIAGFIAVSELVRTQYLSANPEYQPHRVVVIPNGVDDRRFGPRDRAQAREWLDLGDEFVFVSMARYHVQKNTFGLVAAFSEVAQTHPEARLVCAGELTDPSYFEQVHDLRDRLPCAGQISLCGPCPDIASVLAAADAFVLDSFFEGWCLASMEAMFTGLPVVVSEVAGSWEQVGPEGRRGLVVDNPLGHPDLVEWHAINRERFRPQVNRRALVDALGAIIGQRDRWRDLREELRTEATPLFSVERCVGRYAQVLRNAVHDPTRARSDVPAFPVAVE